MKELLGHARKLLGPAVAPRQIAFAESLPRTRSGKIMRRLLKARELGLPEGDTLDTGGQRMSDHRHQAFISIMSTPRKLLRRMMLIRRFEERCAELYGEQKIRGFLHLYVGEEANAVGVMEALTPEDAIVATYREHGHALARGLPATEVMAEMYGKASGSSRGRGGSMHVFDASRRFYGGNAIVGGGLPLAVGLALADKMQGRNRVTCCFFGEGAAAEGAFHESLNLAALWKLPVLFVCENNGYAMGTALDPLRVWRPTSAAMPRAIAFPPKRWTAWTWSPSKRAARARRQPRSAAARGRASSRTAPIASARIRCSIPSSIATRPRFGAGRRAARSSASGTGRCRPASCMKPM